MNKLINNLWATVYKREDISKPWVKIHEGLIIEYRRNFVRVFNPKKNSGDISPEFAEVFAVNSKCIKTSLNEGYFSNIKGVQKFQLPDSIFNRTKQEN